MKLFSRELKFGARVSQHESAKYLANVTTALPMVLAIAATVIRRMLLMYQEWNTLPYHLIFSIPNQ